MANTSSSGLQGTRQGTVTQEVLSFYVLPGSNTDPAGYFQGLCGTKEKYLLDLSCLSLSSKPLNHHSWCYLCVNTNSDLCWTSNRGVTVGFCLRIGRLCLAEFFLSKISERFCPADVVAMLKGGMVSGSEEVVLFDLQLFCSPKPQHACCLIFLSSIPFFKPTEVHS